MSKPKVTKKEKTYYVGDHSTDTKFGLTVLVTDNYDFHGPIFDPEVDRHPSLILWKVYESFGFSFLLSVLRELMNTEMDLIDFILESNADDLFSPEELYQLLRKKDRIIVIEVETETEIEK